MPPTSAPPKAAWLRPAVRSLVVLLLGLALVNLGNSVPEPAMAGQLFGGVNPTLTLSTGNARVSELVTFSYQVSPPAVAPPFASITSLMLDFGDGTTADLSSFYAAGQTVSGSTTHSYSSPGVYTAVLSAAASNGASGQTSASLNVRGGGPVSRWTVSGSAAVNNDGTWSYSAQQRLDADARVVRVTSGDCTSDPDSAIVFEATVQRDTSSGLLGADAFDGALQPVGQPGILTEGSGWAQISRPVTLNPVSTISLQLGGLNGNAAPGLSLLVCFRA